MRQALLLAFIAAGVFITASCEDETISPCKGVDCANGTTCNDGDCNCPRRYKGRECRQEKTPQTVQIAEVRITDAPQFTQEGNSWDPSSNPDVFFVIADPNNKAKASKVINDARISNTLTFNNSSTFPLTLNKPAAQYNLFIGDANQSTNNQIMDEVKITPFKKGADFPETVSFNGDNNTKFELDFQYKFPIE